MSKLTARAHQPTSVSLQLTPEEAALLLRIRKRWIHNQDHYETVTRMVLDLGLQQWELLRQTVVADQGYMNVEGLPNCLGLWEARLRQKANRKFVA